MKVHATREPDSEVSATVRNKYTPPDAKGQLYISGTKNAEDDSLDNSGHESEA